MYIYRVTILKKQQRHITPLRVILFLEQCRLKEKNNKNMHFPLKKLFQYICFQTQHDNMICACAILEEHVVLLHCIAWVTYIFVGVHVDVCLQIFCLFQSFCNSKVVIFVAIFGLFSFKFDSSSTKCRKNYRSIHLGLFVFNICKT